MIHSHWFQTPDPRPRIPVLLQPRLLKRTLGLMLGIQQRFTNQLFYLLRSQLLSIMLNYLAFPSSREQHTTRNKCRISNIPCITNSDSLFRLIGIIQICRRWYYLSNQHNTSSLTKVNVQKISPWMSNLILAQGAHLLVIQHHIRIASNIVIVLVLQTALLHLGSHQFLNRS